MDPKFISDFDLILVYTDQFTAPRTYYPAELIAYYDWIYKEGTKITDFDDHFNQHVLVIDVSGVN